MHMIHLTDVYSNRWFPSLHPGSDCINSANRMLEREEFRIAKALNKIYFVTEDAALRYLNFFNNYRFKKLYADVNNHEDGIILDKVNFKKGHNLNPREFMVVSVTVDSDNLLDIYDV